MTRAFFVRVRALAAFAVTASLAGCFIADESLFGGETAIPLATGDMIVQMRVAEAQCKPLYGIRPPKVGAGEVLCPIALVAVSTFEDWYRVRIQEIGEGAPAGMDGDMALRLFRYADLDVMELSAIKGDVLQPGVIYAFAATHKQQDGLADRVDVLMVPCREYPQFNKIAPPTAPNSINCRVGNREDLLTILGDAEKQMRGDIERPVFRLYLVPAADPAIDQSLCVGESRTQSYNDLQLDQAAMEEVDGYALAEDSFTIGRHTFVTLTDEGDASMRSIRLYDNLRNSFCPIADETFTRFKPRG